MSTSTGADPWAVLGLRRGAAPDEVARAWRALAARHHPDVGGDPERFRQLLTARDELAAVGSRTGSSAGVRVVRRQSATAGLLRPIRRRVDRRLRPRVR